MSDLIEIDEILDTIEDGDFSEAGAWSLPDNGLVIIGGQDETA